MIFNISTTSVYEILVWEYPAFKNYERNRKFTPRISERKEEKVIPCFKQYHFTIFSKAVRYEHVEKLFQSLFFGRISIQLDATANFAS